MFYKKFNIFLRLILKIIFKNKKIMILIHPEVKNILNDIN
jgi:hypothetical protein